MKYFQTSQVGLELAEKSARVTELEDFLSLRDKEMKQLQDKLRELVRQNVMKDFSSFFFKGLAFHHCIAIACYYIF